MQETRSVPERTNSSREAHEVLLDKLEDAFRGSSVSDILRTTIRNLLFSLSGKHAVRLTPLNCWAGLPVELVLLIFINLKEPKDFVSCKLVQIFNPPPNKWAKEVQVCKGWKRIIDDQAFWKQLLQYRWGVKLNDLQPSTIDDEATKKKGNRKGKRDQIIDKLSKEKTA